MKSGRSNMAATADVPASLFEQWLAIQFNFSDQWEGAKNIFLIDYEFRVSWKAETPASEP